MYIVIGILAGIIILQFIIMWKYQRQVKDICRQLAFLMKHDSNMLIQREFDLGGIGTLSDRLNELLELQRKEKQRYQEKEALIADTYTNLSHDIRTPLTSLDGYFQLMEECENVEDQRRYLNIIHERIHSLNEMLEELFMFTKLKNESYSLELTPCCINRILKETVFSYYDDWVRRGIQPDIQITEELLSIAGNKQDTILFLSASPLLSSLYALHTTDSCPQASPVPLQMHVSAVPEHLLMHLSVCPAFPQKHLSGAPASSGSVLCWLQAVQGYVSYP